MRGRLRVRLRVRLRLRLRLTLKLRLRLRLRVRLRLRQTLKLRLRLRLRQTDRPLNHLTALKSYHDLECKGLFINDDITFGGYADPPSPLSSCHLSATPPPLYA